MSSNLFENQTIINDLLNQNDSLKLQIENLENLNRNIQLNLEDERRRSAFLKEEKINLENKVMELEKIHNLNIELKKIEKKLNEHLDIFQEKIKDIEEIIDKNKNNENEEESDFPCSSRKRRYI